MTTEPTEEELQEIVQRQETAESQEAEAKQPEALDKLQERVKGWQKNQGQR